MSANFSTQNPAQAEEDSFDVFPVTATRTYPKVTLAPVEEDSFDVFPATATRTDPKPTLAPVEEDSFDVFPATATRTYPKKTPTPEDSFDVFPVTATRTYPKTTPAPVEEDSFDVFPATATRTYPKTTPAPVEEDSFDAFPVTATQSFPNKNTNMEDDGSWEPSIWYPQSTSTPKATPTRNSKSGMKRLCSAGLKTPSKRAKNSSPRLTTGHVFGKRPNLCAKRNLRLYGGGDSHTFVKKTTFPNEEEERFFLQHVEISQNPFLHRENSHIITMEPIRMRFKSLNSKKSPAVLHLHAAKLFDIFIRGIIKMSGGDLKTTKFWIQLKHGGYAEKGGFYVNHKTYQTIDGGVLMNTIARQMQSNKELRLDESFAVHMNVFHEKEDHLKGHGVLKPRGVRGISKIREYMLKEYFGMKHEKVAGPTHCLPKALMLGKLESDLRACTNPDEKVVLARKLRVLTKLGKSESAKCTDQLREAKNFLKTFGLNEETESHDVDDLREFAKHLPDYQIILWAADGNVPVEIERFNPDGKGFIGIFHCDGHYEYVVHMTGKNPARFCYKCSKFDGRHHYRYCKARCRRCGHLECVQGSEKIHCDKCNIYFKSQMCYDNHLKSVSHRALPHCRKYYMCPKCLLIDRTAEYRTDSAQPHICGATHYCSICKAKVLKNHICAHHIPTDAAKKRKRDRQEKWKIIVYDMECIVSKSGDYTGYTEQSPKHKPNVICTQMFCNNCLGVDGCPSCQEPQTYSFKDDNAEGGTPLSRFACFLINDPRSDGAYIIAHNGGRYDHIMLLAELDRLGGLNAQEPKILLDGMTLISAEFIVGKKKLYFRDSLKYLTMMPKAFGLVEEVKGFFPYLYNHPDNYSKNLKTLPPKEYYSPEFMSPKKLEEFNEWYSKCYNDGFVLHDEILKYCKSDVRILTRALVEFVKICAKIFNGWNPFTNGCTLASFVQFVMKHEYIKKGEVGYVPENGYGGGNNSKIALKYIQWLEKKDPNLKFQYKLRGGEKKINAGGWTYYVDAFNSATNEVFEIYGCVYHGCPKCLKVRDQKSSVRKEYTVDALYQMTIRREERIRNEGYVLKAKWECEINKELSEDQEMTKFFKLNNYTQRLQPREGLYGGRTQAFRAHVEATPSHKLEYQDFVSMYPYLNAGGTEYPVGNPIIITDDFPDVDKPLDIKGIVYCDVLPAIDAPMGYLPKRINQKMMFPLCNTCAQNQCINSPCTHLKVSERYITGVWTTAELTKAIEKGYKVLKYHEIWYWKDWMRGGFFAEYIKPLLKMKHESSGWPRVNMTESEKNEYVERIRKNDGVTLDQDNIKPNPSIRSLAKIFLNCAWGKFAQNPMKTETRLIEKSLGSTIAQFFNDPNYEPATFLPYGEEKFLISRKPKDSTLEATPFANLPIAIITTSAARLRLLDAIERVGVSNMIYCDTDSLIFKEKRGEDALKQLKGEQLGFLTNEIKEGLELVEVIVMAPKVYGLKMVDKDGNFSYSVKAKGITLNSATAESVNFEAMKNTMSKFISNEEVDPLLGEALQFKRGDNALDGLWTCKVTKQLRPHMDKGHFNEGVVAPFGWLPSNAILIDDYPF